MLYEEEHVIPPYGIDSPVVKHLLDNWTEDMKKVIHVMKKNLIHHQIHEVYSIRMIASRFDTF